ncbi:hypothetical protein LCGC14_1289140 [marine sediment metagenome]|uniref:Uncharacterized protein n=1 Tax=marine sediment metagenome TaxID=412755 RepID=A0A0F9LDW7_9ZZZZ
MNNKKWKPRAYASVTFRNAYQTCVTRYDWFAASKRYRTAPTEGEWIANGLSMYDQLSIAITTTAKREVVDLSKLIVKLMIDEVRDIARGLIVQRTDPVTKVRSMTTHYDLSWDKENFPGESEARTLVHEDGGFAAVEDAEMMRMRMRMLSQVLTDNDMEVLIQYVSGEAASLREASRTLGYTGTMYDKMRYRIRRACKGLEMTDAFYSW